MRLDEIVSWNAGLWVSPAAQILNVNTTHIDDVIAYPDKFGVTSDYINDAYKRHGEQVGQEGEAREEIIRYVLTRGWIRVRKYKNYWSVTIDSFSNSIKKTIRNFVHTMLDNKAMGPYDDLKILAVRNDEMKEIEASDVIQNGLNEGLEILEFVTFDKVASILNESSLSRIHGKLGKHVAGAITAYRSEFTHKENQQRNKSLVAKLMSAGYSVTAIQGSYVENYGSADSKEVSEHSFFVVNDKVEGDDTGKLKADLIRFGQEFDQDSILFVPVDGNAMLIGTSKRENAYPNFGQSESVGKFKGGKAAQFMSRINGRSFVYEDLNLPGTINGIRGMKILAEKNWQDLCR